MNNFLEVISCDYHRNGISGQPFHTVHFNWNAPDDQCKNMVATVFQDDKYVAVLCLDDLSRRWRGDHFESSLRDYINED